MVEFEEAKWPRQIIGAMVICVLVIAVGQPVHSLHFEFNPYFPEIGFLVIAGVWFGAWGVLAAFVGSTIVNLSIYTLTPAALFSTSALFQALIPACAFKLFEGDPRLNNWKAILLFVVFGVMLPSVVSTEIISTVWPHYIHIQVAFNTEALFISSTVSATSFGFPLLLLGSRIVIRARAYCKGWFS